MAKNDTSKSKAELYREERKQRIAKASKKNAKGNSKAARVAGKIVAAVLIICIVALAGWYITATTGLVDKCTTALKVGDTKISTVLYNYYYKAEYQQTSYYADYYSQYGMDMGFNANLSPDDPSNTTTDEDGNSITWAQAFKNSAIERAQFVEAYYAEAVKAGCTLSDDEKSEIEETITSYSEQATENGYSLNAYLKAAFGAGFNEKLFRKQLEKESIAQNFYNDKQSEFTDGVTAEKVSAEYKANPFKYDYADIRYYSLPLLALTAEEGETAEALAARQKTSNAAVVKTAEEICAKITDENSFIAAAKAKENEGKENASDDDVTTLSETAQYSSISSAISEVGAKWAFDTARKAGDKKVFETDGYVYIVMVIKPAYTSNSVDVRHCFINFNAADSENGPTDAEKKAAKEKADKLYNEWKSGTISDDTFAKLANDNTEDDGSKGNGGLYEGVRISDSMYPEFLDWCFADGRKDGDHGVIESQSGYHIMYMKKINKNDTDRDNFIRTELGSTAFTEYNDKLLADDGAYKTTENAKWINRVVDRFCSDIRKNLAYSNQ